MLLDGLLLVDVRGGVHDFLEGIDEAVAAVEAYFTGDGSNGFVAIVFYIVQLFTGEIDTTLVEDGTEVLVVFFIDDFGDIGGVGTCELNESIKIKGGVAKILSIGEDGFNALRDDTIGIVRSKREKRRNRRSCFL